MFGSLAYVPRVCWTWFWGAHPTISHMTGRLPYHSPCLNSRSSERQNSRGSFEWEARLIRTFAFSSLHLMAYGMWSVPLRWVFMPWLAGWIGGTGVNNPVKYGVKNGTPNFSRVKLGKTMKNPCIFGHRIIIPRTNWVTVPTGCVVLVVLSVWDTGGLEHSGCFSDSSTKGMHRS